MMMDRRYFLRNLGLVLGGGMAATKLGGCFLDTSGLAIDENGYVEQLDASPEPDPDIDPTGRDAGSDASDGGPQCDYTNDQLAELIFEKIPLYDGAPDLEQMIRDQRVVEGYTLGQIFDAAESSATAYTWAGFKARYDANPEVRSALYETLSARIEQATCAAEDSAKQAVLDEVIRQMFGGGSNPVNFELRRSINGDGEPKSVYFANLAADSPETSYMVLIGAKVTKDGSQHPEPMALYFTPADGIYNTLFNLEQGGI
jgi:hypothetical protein